MPGIKTGKTDNSVTDYINSIEPAGKRNDSLKLNKIFEDITGKKAELWSNNMIGYGTYHYKSSRSTQEGDWPLTGFSPRKQNISIYIMPGIGCYESFLGKIGKHKASKGSCLYINKLSDINIDILSDLIRQSFEDMKRESGDDSI